MCEVQCLGFFSNSNSKRGQIAYDTHNLQGDPIVSHYPPHGASVDHVEGILEDNET